MKLKLLQPTEPVASYIPAVRTGNLLFVSGYGPVKKGGIPTATGKVGKDLTEEQARKVAQEVMLRMLGVVKATIGDLDKVKRVVKLLGLVASSPGFNRQPWVINGASDLLIQLYGERGRHARSAIGVNELPLNIPVEIEMILEVED